jgi:N-acetylmuramoyl-L-alanine amidase
MELAETEAREKSRGLGLLVTVFALLGLLFSTLAHPAHAEEPAIATGARVGGDEVRTRFVADLSKPVSYSVYVLPDPYRVMIDLPDVTFDLEPGSGEKTLGLISEYRYGEVAPGRSRIVIDTAGPVLIEKSFIVEAKGGQPARIVVDLVKTSAEAFEKTLVKDEITSASAIAGAEELPKEAEAVEEPDNAVQAEQKSDKRIVVIDPGHGGIDPGAIGYKRTKEKDVVLAVGLKLRDALLRTGGFEVIMTRDDDKFLSLKDRVRVARNSTADLFIALHADTVRGPAASGATIYTLSDKASDAEAEALAEKENRADIIAGIDLGAESEEVADILIDLVQRESKHHALVFAKKAVGEMQKVTEFTGKPLRSAGFVVLKAPDVPSVLVELGYLSTKQDATQLVNPKWQTKVADAMAGAVAKYFATEVAQTN